MVQHTLKNGFILKSGYQNGLVGKITALHGKSYIEDFSFGKFFECKVATELSQFIESYDPVLSEIWSISKEDEILGSITLDGSHANKDGAHLRWFILDSKAKGFSLGGLLLETVIQFCKDHNYPSIYLYTLEGLEPAGKIYRSRGFKLEDSRKGTQWGSNVQEERLRLTL